MESQVFHPPLLYCQTNTPTRIVDSKTNGLVSSRQSFLRVTSPVDIGDLRRDLPRLDELSCEMMDDSDGSLSGASV